ncbi:P-loop containing nucleoside triphosphate hydrolase protein [Annulohypoxylon nitens]|nr:P-loop containing nucleoside triphosphate hydrolase protein [Annulohypoxylon nitens]
MQPVISQSYPGSPESTEDSSPTGWPFEQTLSNAEQEWNRRKDLDGDENSVLDELMQYEGLQQVKQMFLDIMSKVKICKDQGRNLNSERFNIVMQGNPGTGKTTIARLYAKFLESLAVLKCGSVTVKETSGIKLATKGVQALKRKLKNKFRRGQGYILIVDEAYQLTAPYIHGTGRPVLDTILTMMENNIDRFIVIFTGYKEEMETFFEHNAGLRSRIPHTINFEDFTDHGLWKVLQSNIHTYYDNRMRVEGGMDGLYMRIVIRRLATGRGKKGFGNARAVQNIFSNISQRQAARLVAEGRHCRQPDKFIFTKEDMIGMVPLEVAHKSKEWNQLQKLVGLDHVKECVSSMIGLIQRNYQRELKELEPINFSLNQVFVGAPGTGKTTVAKLYGRILADLGYLSHGDVILKTAADFIGDHLGGSEAQTKRILDASIGKVLVIDEAYMLDAGKEQDKFKTAAIDTLVSIVQGVPGEDRCIIVVGYEDKIRTMFRNSNPGLSRRFPVEQPFRFKDFTLKQLEQILHLKLDGYNLSCTSEAIDVARAIFKRALMRPRFMNAGEVDALLETAKMNYIKRLSRKPFDDEDPNPKIEASDIDADLEWSSRLDYRQTLESLAHRSIADQIVRYQTRFSQAKRFNLEPTDVIPTRFVFKGPSGTGKTATAQKMGDFFHSMGFLSAPEVVECSATDLIGQYVGHTAPKTKEKLLDAIGRVLFIDDAHRLGDSSYANEAVDELVRFLAHPSNQSNVIIILAGHTEGVNELITRQGLSNVFSEEIIFEHIPLDDCVSLLARELERKGFVCEEQLLDNPQSLGYVETRKLFNKMQSIPSWSNARDIKDLSKSIIGTFLESHDTNTQVSRVISQVHITSCMLRMITQRKKSCTVPKTSSNSSPPQEPDWWKYSRPMTHYTEPIEQPPPQTITRSIPGVKTRISPGKDAKTNVKEDTNNTQSMSLRSAVSQISLKANDTVTCVHEAEHVPEHVETREDDVSDAVWQQLCESKKTESLEREKDEAKIKHLEQEKKKTGENLVKHEGEDYEDMETAYREASTQLNEIRQFMKDKRKIQEALRKMGRCVYGFRWIRVADGYRCAGGYHFVSDNEVKTML